MNESDLKGVVENIVDELVVALHAKVFLSESEVDFFIDEAPQIIRRNIEPFVDPLAS